MKHAKLKEEINELRQVIADYILRVKRFDKKLLKLEKHLGNNDEPTNK